MKKSDMKRELFRVASEAIASYPYKPADIIGDRVAEARWEDAKDEVSERLVKLSRPRQKKKLDQSK